MKLNNFKIDFKESIIFFSDFLAIGAYLVARATNTLVIVFIASYYRQIKTSFVKPEVWKSQPNKTGINFTIFILMFVVNRM